MTADADTPGPPPRTDLDEAIGERVGLWGKPNAGIFWAGVWLVYLLPALVEALDARHSLMRNLVGAALVLAFAVLYLVVMRRSWDRDPSTATVLNEWPQPMTAGRWRMVGLLIVIAIVSVVLIGEPAAGMIVFLAPVASSSLSFEQAFAGILVVVGAVSVAEVVAVRPPGDKLTAGSVAGSAFGALMAGLITLGIRRMRSVMRELQIARSREQELASAQERVRIARDLHDLLGHSLTVISVRSQLAQKLSERGEHARAGAEIAAVSELSRSAMADVRAAVEGYRGRPLATELAAAEAALDGAGISVSLERPVEALPPAGEEALGFVVREGVTNVLRHSRARSCAIRIARVADGFVAEVSDDGAGLGQPLREVDPTGGVGEGVGGNGLRGLAERVIAAGGRLSAGDRDGRFVLRAEVAG